MNPADAATAAHPGTNASPAAASHLKIVKVELPQQSTHRYSVILRLCRALTDHEVHELVAHLPHGLEVRPDDASQLIATRTTIEDVCDRLPEFHELLAVASAEHDVAHDTLTQTQARVARGVEEARRQALVTEINARLGA